MNSKYIIFDHKNRKHFSVVANADRLKAVEEIDFIIRHLHYSYSEYKKNGTFTNSTYENGKPLTLQSEINLLMRYR